MKFTVKNIQTLQRGREYYRQGHVVGLETTYQDHMRVLRCSADVKGSGGMMYWTELLLSANADVEEMYCDCPAFEEYAGPCKHLVALACAVEAETAGRFRLLTETVKVREGRPVPGKPALPKANVRQSDQGVSLCIQKYEERNLSKIKQIPESVGTVHVIAKLVIDYPQIWVELTAGSERQYVVRSLEEFCRQLCDGEVITMGKKLTFTGSMQAFHADSRELMGLIVARYKECVDLDRVAAFGYISYSHLSQLFAKGKRGMLLTPAALDQFLGLFVDQQLELEKKDRYTFHYGGRGLGKAVESGFVRRVCVRAGSPRISVEVHTAEEGVTFSSKNLPMVLKGQDHIYLYFAKDPEHFWMCDGEYAVNMESFLESFAKGQGTVFVSENDMVRFCSNVMIYIQNYVDFSGDTECLENYTPAEMEARVYLDSPVPEVITAMVKGNYDGILVNLYNDKVQDERPEEVRGSERGKLLRNDVQEHGVRTLLERYFPTVDASTGTLVMQGDNDSLYTFMNEGQQELSNHAQIFVTERYRRMIVPPKTKLAAGVSLDGELLKVTFELEGFDMDELLDALSSYHSRKRYHRLKNGTFLSLEDEELKDVFQFVDGMHLSQKDLQKGSLELPKYRAMYLDDMMKHAGKVRFDRDAQFRGLIREVRGIEDSELQPPERLLPILRDYQKTGFCWLKTMAKLGFGGILADDMGLGKTLEVLALLVDEANRARGKSENSGESCGKSGMHGGLNTLDDMERADAVDNGIDDEGSDRIGDEGSDRIGDKADDGMGSKVGDGIDEKSRSQFEKTADGEMLIPALVVCPASLVLNWDKEIRKFAPELTPITIMGSAAERKRQLLALKNGAIQVKHLGMGAEIQATEDAQNAEDVQNGEDTRNANGTQNIQNTDDARNVEDTQNIRDAEDAINTEYIPNDQNAEDVQNDLDTGEGGALGSRDIVGGSCVVITSYDLLKRDLPLYEGLAFSYHIVDEAQYIKNHSTQNAKAVKGVVSLHRFALTGTPVENRLSELWSIFDFLMPDYLGSYAKFKQNYEVPVLHERDAEAATSLSRQVMPFVLRRLKQKVLSELPDKVESVVCVPLEGEQKKLYLANLAKVKLEIGKEIREGSFETNKLQILALLTKLRQICCHPALCYENYTKGSAKLEACIELVREAVEGGHRVLLFSQFTSMLALIQQRLVEEKIDYYLLTGKTDKAARQRLVNEFNSNQVPVFLISLKAGGTGLNLTGADVVIHYDPWWNRAAQNQATDRAHRIGQKHSVQVYNLVAEGTIEEKIVKLQESKGNLADSIIGENSTLLTMLSEEQLAGLFGM